MFKGLLKGAITCWRSSDVIPFLLHFSRILCFINVFRALDWDCAPGFRGFLFQINIKKRSTCQLTCMQKSFYYLQLILLPLTLRFASSPSFQPTVCRNRPPSQYFWQEGATDSSINFDSDTCVGRRLTCRCGKQHVALGTTCEFCRVEDWRRDERQASLGFIAPRADGDALLKIERRSD